MIAGIDDQFFVTESPITVEGKRIRGKTLYVSLSLLKHLHEAEATAVLAHEMAHFSGRDTLYSKRILPLLRRYENYLQGLQKGLLSLPLYHLMLCFRVLFEISIGKLSRQREFRADQIAAATTSPSDMAAALLRITSYSRFRRSVEEDLYNQEQALQIADVAARIDRGFAEYSLAFAADPEIGNLTTVHPFDSHPPLGQRLSALGVGIAVQDAQSILANLGDGGWRRNILHADQLERQQWKSFETHFRNSHEETLAYRYLPETDEELAVVVKWFPEVVFTSREGKLSIDSEKVHYTPWPDAILFSEFRKCEIDEQGVLQIDYRRDKKYCRLIRIRKFSRSQRSDVAVLWLELAGYAFRMPAATPPAGRPRRSRIERRPGERNAPRP